MKHVLSYHVPETIKEHGQYHKFHQVEQIMESNHRTFKQIVQKWWQVKNGLTRVWGIISEFQAQSNNISSLNVPIA